MTLLHLNRILLLPLLTALASLVTPFASAAVVPTEVVVATWSKQTTHPLAGKIVRTRTGEVIDAVALASTSTAGTPIATALGIKGPAYVLLGEVHDNPEHHWLRASLIPPITEPSAYGPLVHPGVVVEHLDDSKAAALADFSRQAPRTTDNFFSTFQWDKSGWPPAKLFEPLFAAIFHTRLPLSAGNIPSIEIRSLVRTGRNAVQPERHDRLGLARTLPEPHLRALATELKGSHCGMLPDSALEGMALAQHARDASMAHAMVDAVDRHGRSILLAGNGHVRTDRGVPWHIRAIRPNATVIAVMLAEVEDGRNDPFAYIPRDPLGNPAVDIIIFTPRTDRDDPCARMRQHMQQKK